MRKLIFIPLLLLFAACGSQNPDAAAAETAPALAVAGTFGEEFTAEEVVPALEILETYDVTALSDTVSATLSGTVNEVCQAKGCWMTIATGSEAEMMVKFKDYGFFVPKDISGREVVMNGKAYYQVTPVDELRHYAEDAGKSEEDIAKITEPKRELRFLADGVQLMSK